MRFLSLSTTALTLLALSTGIAAAASHGNSNVMSGKVAGEVYIMNETHMAVYTYDKDEPGVSNCYGPCADKWPPVLLDADADMPESYTLIKRKDGNMQVAYKNQPLYLWVGDAKIGDMKGDGVGGVWRLARP